MMDNRTRNRIMMVLFIGVLMGALDAAIVGPALPALKKDFMVDERSLSWVFTIYVLFMLISTPLMSKLSDRTGRRLIYVLDVALFAVGSLVVALSPSFPMLLVGRAIQGFGAGGIFPIASAVIGDIFPPEKRGTALGLIGAVFGLAFIIGPILGGLLLKFSWHWLFYINLPIAFIVIIFAIRTIPSTSPSANLPFDWAGLFILAIILTALSLGLNQLDGQTFKIWPWLLLILGMGLLSIFGAVETRAKDPIFRFSMLGSQQLLLANVLAFGSGMGMLSISFLPSLLTSAFAINVSTASFMLIPLIIAMMVGAPLSGRLLDKIGSKMVISAGTGILSLGWVLMSLAPLSRLSFYGISILIGIGLSALLGAPIRYIVINAAPADMRAVAQGTISVMSSIGQLLTAPLMGAVASSMGGSLNGYRAGYFVIGIITIGMLLASLKLKGRADEFRAHAASESSHLEAS